VAEIVYQWVSRNRHLLSKVFGCKDACALLPAKKRQQDKLA
jgi:predicted DCC family thiol-disulfide oxidoreductase YuxK